MNKNVVKIIIGSVLVAGAVYGILWLRRQYQAYQKSIFEFVGVHLGSLNLRRINLTFFFRYVNEMDVSFYVLDQYYEVYFNGHLVKVINNPERVDIPARSDTRIPVNVDFSPGEAIKAALPNLNAILYDHRKLKIKIKGYLTIGGVGVEVQRKPVDYVDTLAGMMGH